MDIYGFLDIYTENYLKSIRKKIKTVEIFIVFVKYIKLKAH